MEAINALLMHEASSSSPSRKDGGAIVVLLKKGCLKALRAPNALSRAAGYVGPVMAFLLDFVLKRPDHILQIAEVLNILLSSSEWLEYLQQDGHRDGVLCTLIKQLTVEQQAVLGLQNDSFLSLLDSEVAQLATERASKLLQDAGQVRMELDRIRAGLGEGGLRFKSSVQELRFEPSYRSGSNVLSDPNGRPEFSGVPALDDSSPSGWRSTTTPEGSRYYYHPRTKEIRGVPPQAGRNQESEVPSAKPRVGEKVEVFSNSARRWCPGFVEKVGRNEVTIAFQLSDARANEWSKKTLALGHPELRWVSRPSGSPMPAPGSGNFTEKRALCKTPSGFFGTSLPTNWTSEEVQLYDPLFADLDSTIKAEGGGLGTDGVDPVAFLQSEYLAQCGLPRKALREIWQVANPHLKSSLGLEEFRASCRLVGHCQAWSTQDDKVSRRLRSGGGGLRAELRSECLGQPPPQLPDFTREPLNPKKETSRCGTWKLVVWGCYKLKN